MKAYTITRSSDSVLHLLCEAQTKAGVVWGYAPGPFDIGNVSQGTKALASAIMNHYYGAANDPAAAAEAERKTESFMQAFLVHHQMKSGARYEISSEVIDRWL